MIELDSFFVFVLTYLLTIVEECPWDFTIFEKIIIATLAVIIYNGLIRVKVLGGIIMLAVSEGVTWLILQLMPLMKWVNGSRAWYWGVSMVFYVLVAILHGPWLLESFSDVELTWRKVKKRCQSWKAKATGHSRNSGYSGKGSYTSGRDNSYLGYGQRAEYGSSYSGYGRTEDNFGRSGDGYGQAGGYGSVNSGAQTEAINFFTGCKTEEEVKKRLRALTKTFHPDNSEGDEETYKKILVEYENLKGKFGA